MKAPLAIASPTASGTFGAPSLDDARDAGDQRGPDEKQVDEGQRPAGQCGVAGETKERRIEENEAEDGEPDQAIAPTRFQGHAARPPAVSGARGAGRPCSRQW